MAPLVSFVMTVYNGASYLEEALRGLLRVEWPDYEIVIIDDGSTDNSPEISRTLANENARIRFYQCGRSGRGRALNFGVAFASGEFIAINDADDYSLPNRLRITVPVLQREEVVSFVTGSHKVIPEAMWSTEMNQALPPFCQYRLISCRDLYKRNPFVHSALTFRKSLWEHVGGYNETMSSHIDYEFYFRLLSKGPGCHADDIVVLHRRTLNTSFKQRSAAEYVSNHKAALRTARERCSVPLIYRIYDFKPYFMAARRAWRGGGFSSFKQAVQQDVGEFPRRQCSRISGNFLVDRGHRELPPSKARPPSEIPRCVALVNMVPPYRLRVFEGVAERFAGEFVVVSCTRIESNRHWQALEGNFEHHVLRGFELRLGGRGILHVNPSVVSLLRRLDPAVLCLGGFTPTMLAALLYARICSIPYILMMDGWAGADSKLGSPYHWWVRRTFVHRAAAGVGVGEKSMQWFESYGLARDRLFLSPLVPSWRPPSVVPSFQERNFDLLWCGTIDERKNIRFFVELAVILNKALGEVKVRVVGEGPMKNWCERVFSEQGIATYFDGFVHGDAICHCFTSARLFLFPTRHDPWGLVANEAMQCGTPVLISPHAGAAGEAVRHQLDGYVLPLDTHAWTDAALKLLRSPHLWEEMSRCARAHSLFNSPERAAEGLLGAILFGMRSNAENRS